MKRAICILFLTTYLFSNTELSQLLKMPVLVAHFMEHQSLNENITLLQFLKIHYLEDISKNWDYEKDKKLPFKTHDSCHAQIGIAIPPSFLYTIKKFIFFSLEMEKRAFYNCTFHSSFLATIWQPPRQNS